MIHKLNIQISSSTQIKNFIQMTTAITAIMIINISIQVATAIMITTMELKIESLIQMAKAIMIHKMYHGMRSGCMITSYEAKLEEWPMYLYSTKETRNFSFVEGQSGQMLKANRAKC